MLLFFICDHRIAFILDPCSAFVGTVGNALLFIFAMVGKYCDQPCGSAEKSLVSFSSTTTEPEKYSSQLIGFKSDGQVLPMDHILRQHVPMHRPSVYIIRIILIKQVIFSFKVNQSIGIIRPPEGRRKMILRPMRFCNKACLYCFLSKFLFSMK